MPLTTQSANRKDINTGIADMQHRHFATIAAIIRELDSGGGRMQHRRYAPLYGRAFRR